jgi:RNA polymerase sigma factor (sigma-70 family)
MECPNAQAAAPEPRPAFRALLQQVLAGSENAARQLHQEYGKFIMMAVREKLSRQMRSKYDSVDFAQDVWLSFLRMPDAAFENPDHLIGYLVRMARNKVIDATRDRMESAKHDIRREEPLESSVDGQERQKAFAHDGTPSEAAISLETWQRMLEGQPPAYRKVLMLLRDGCTQDEVSEQLNLCRKTVQRIHRKALERVRK